MSCRCRCRVLDRYRTKQRHVPRGRADDVVVQVTERDARHVRVRRRPRERTLRRDCDAIQRPATLVGRGLRASDHPQCDHLMRAARSSIPVGGVAGHRPGTCSRSMRPSRRTGDFASALWECSSATDKLQRRCLKGPQRRPGRDRRTTGRHGSAVRSGPDFYKLVDSRRGLMPRDKRRILCHGLADLAKGLAVARQSVIGEAHPASRTSCPAGLRPSAPVLASAPSCHNPLTPP